MSAQSRAELMHLVLDGEASSEELNALQLLLATDAQAHAEFDELKTLFQQLDSVPAKPLPEGLAAAVMKAVDARQIEISSQSHQPFPTSGVFGSTPRKSAVDRVISTTRQSKHSALFKGILIMSQQASSIFSNRKVWGGAVALAAVFGVTQFGFDLPPFGGNVVGTIAPAERYRAPQAGAEAVKLGGSAGTQGTAAVAGEGKLEASQQSAVQKEAIRTQGAEQDAKTQGLEIQGAQQDAKTQGLKIQGAQQDAKIQGLKIQGAQQDAKIQGAQQDAKIQGAQQEAIRQQAVQR